MFCYVSTSVFTGDIQLNPGPVSLKSQYVSSPLDVYEPFLSPTVQKLRLATLNSRSVVNKSAVINNHILENKIDILCITETWINDGEFSNSLLSSLIPSNYVLSQYYGRPRPFRGVAIINHKSVHHTHVSTPVFSTFECVGSVITSSNSSFKLFVVYRPPSSSMSTFFTEFESLLEFHISANIDLIFVGDFNIHIDDLNDVNSIHFLKLLNTFNLCQHVSFPTQNSGHVLDLIITNASSNLVTCPFLLDTYISDHKTVCVDIDLPKPNINKVTFSYRPINKINFTDFNQDISNAFSNIDNFNLDSLIDHFNSNMSLILDKYAPLKTVTVKPRTSNPWFTSNLRSERSIRRQLERTWRKTRNESDKLAYKKQCHLYNSKVKKAQSDYFSSLFKSNSNTKELWHSIDKLLNRSSSSLPNSSSKHSADQFCTYFVDKIKTLRSKLPLIDLNPLSLPDKSPPIFSSFKLVSVDEIKQLILSSPKSTCLLDPVPSNLLPHCIDSIAPIITRIVNLSLSSGVFSKQLKSALVKPLLKKSNLDPNDLKNYRPISNLSFLSKLIERVIAARLSSHLSSHNLMSKLQSAYRKFHSSETALLYVQNDILASLDAGHSTALLLLDLSAAFDTIDHSILIHRLQHWFGISSTALNLLSSFLSDRFQTVITPTSKSNPVLLEYGVPQGSVLGPLLYSLYTTPLHSIISKYPGLRCHFYADDTQIYLSFSPELASSAFTSIETCIKDIFTWMIGNKLSVNPDKTEYLLFNSKNINVPVSINLNLNNISPSECAKNLGVIFQSDMSMDKHITSVVKTCFHQLREFRHIRSFIPKSAAIIFANAFIHSRIDYCNSLFYGLPKYSINRLQKIQNSVARIVTRTSRSSHITPVLKSLHWLPVQYRINFKLCCITHCALSLKEPYYLNSLLINRLNSHSLRSSSFNPLTLLFFNKKSNGFRSFAHAAPFLWNHLLNTVRSAPTYLSFRKSLKTYFFNQAFPT